MTKPLHVFIRQEGKHYRVKYQRHYPNNVVEEVVLTQRFNSLADAQRFADAGLLAQHIYGGLTDRKSQGNGAAAVGDRWPSKLDYGPTS
jgi:hypothetical protein